MRSALVKCCGFRDSLSLMALDGVDLDFAGFILAPSKRQITEDQLAAIIADVPSGIKKVGVLVDPTLEEIERILSRSPLDVIQLHGQESPQFCRQVKENWNVELIKAFHIKKESLELPSSDYEPWIDYLLLDTFDPQAAGGTGKSFCWEQIPPYHQWCLDHQVKLMVAGGIHAQNAGQLLADWPLDGIDVASGVETDGVKDIQKVRELVERVKGNVNRAK